MERPQVEALLQGALDNTLTPEQQATLRRVMAGSAEVRERAAHLERLAHLLDSERGVEPPPRLVQDVLARISSPGQFPLARPSIRVSTSKRGVPVKKNILFGLAAAAVLVLAVITFYNYPPATVGTEATIGAAQRAQAPQIAAKDVGLGDTSIQSVLQTETWDLITKDEAVRGALQDPHFVAALQDAELRRALSDDAVRVALKDQSLVRWLESAAAVRALSDNDLIRRLENANLRRALENQAFVDALRRVEIRALLMRQGTAAALAGPAFQAALRDRGFEAALKSQWFSESMARAARTQ